MAQGSQLIARSSKYYYITTLQKERGWSELRIDGIAEIGFALLRQTTRPLATPELRNYGIAE